MGNCSVCSNYCDPQNEYMSNHNLENAPKNATFRSKPTQDSMTHSSFNILSAVTNNDVENKVVLIQKYIRGHIVRKHFELPYYKSMANNQVNCKYFTKEEAQETISKQPLNMSQRREKRQPYKYKSGAVYDGEWLGGFRDGFGTMTWSDGAQYIGNWKLNKACGKGQFIHAEGDVYDGMWFNDKACGYGVYQHTNGAMYQGEWKDDLQHGHGYEKWIDGSSYLGEYKYGQKEGIGLYKWNDGSDYEGEWRENKINGVVRPNVYIQHNIQGIYTWLDGRNYEGQWKNNNMDGIGCYTWADGRKYEGEYDEDQKNGYGVYHWADGRVYMGYWYRGKQYGLGTYKTASDDKLKYGLWEEGRRVKWFSDNDVVAISNLKLDYMQFFTMAKSSDIASPYANFNPPMQFEQQLRKIKQRVSEIRIQANQLKSKTR